MKACEYVRQKKDIPLLMFLIQSINQGKLKDESKLVHVRLIIYLQLVLES